MLLARHLIHGRLSQEALDHRRLQHELLAMILRDDEAEDEARYDLMEAMDYTYRNQNAAEQVVSERYWRDLCKSNPNCQ